jgi:7,8-dihydropterin-6-yl-methyl-4-(beta-D-ribofuranosyl)aminobenzene 5'-phosphate synthase
VKLTVLVDNNTFINRYYIGEPAVSYFVECDGKKILFDVGYSDAFIGNARKLGCDLTDIDCLALSHGHIDHIGGLPRLLRLYAESGMAKSETDKPALITHPFALLRQILERPGKEKLDLRGLDPSDYFQIQETREPLWITDRLVFLGEVARDNDFEARTPFGKIIRHGVEEDDFVIEDSALAYKSDDGLVIITGCSHSGICNIVEYACRVCGEMRVVDIIGGFHLLNPEPATLQKTIEYMKSLNPAVVHVCHCTDLKSKIALANAVNIEEVGVGLTLEY